MTLADVRQFLAEEIRVAANIRSQRIIEALSTVPRERFLPPGPWEIRGIADIGAAPRRTDDANPSHVYHDIAVAIDPARNLYNGQPSLIARWLDELALEPGQRILHIGCGMGYFTAVIAHIVGPRGRVDAIEVDADLAARARTNLAEQSWVHVRHGNGASDLPPTADRILVHAGATHILDAWLDLLPDDGRLLVPLTTEFPGMPIGIGKGVMLLVSRQSGGWPARACQSLPVAIYSLKELRDARLGAEVAEAIMSGALPRGTHIRRDSHDRGGSCLVHGPTNCLST